MQYVLLLALRLRAHNAVEQAGHYFHIRYDISTAAASYFHLHPGREPEMSDKLRLLRVLIANEVVLAGVVGRVSTGHSEAAPPGLQPDTAGVTLPSRLRLSHCRQATWLRRRVDGGHDVQRWAVESTKEHEDTWRALTRWGTA